MRAAIVIVLLVRAAHAQDQFEIQVYDVEVAPRGGSGAELHASYHDIVGTPDELHVTLEPHYGVAGWIEVGGYLQSATTTTGDELFAGVKLRGKVRYPRRLWRDRLGLALNGELSYVPARFEPNVWGSELRPIVDLAAGRIYAAVNPIVSIDLHGALAGRPQLEPAAKLTVRATTAIAIGVEGYGAYGPIDALGGEHATRAYAVVDLTGAWWDLNVGVGWTWFSPDRAIAKLIFGIHPRHVTARS